MMSNRSLRKVLFAALALTTAGCATTTTTTKREAFPQMYTEQRPLTLLVAPAVNRTTSADAGDLLDVTVTEPFANQGYYVLPMPIVSDIFESEGIVDGEQLLGMPVEVFHDAFGADAVLIVTIDKWETNYLVFAGNLTVGLTYVMRSTANGEVLWSYEGQVVVDTSGSSGNLISDVISTAITTAVTQYVPIAKQVHLQSVAALPYGEYHPEAGLDGDANSVLVDRQMGALEEDEQ